MALLLRLLLLLHLLVLVSPLVRGDDRIPQASSLLVRRATWRTAGGADGARGGLEMLQKSMAPSRHSSTLICLARFREDRELSSSIIMLVVVLPRGGGGVARRLLPLLLLLFLVVLLWNSSSLS